MRPTRWVVERTVSAPNVLIYLPERVEQVPLTARQIGADARLAGRFSGTRDGLDW